ncbi:MAG: DUF368 domain-containing protein, partial [Clostridia bacterium]|nr:DUF368 domain-containing protein [Clostridia bacterium]
VAGFVLLSGLVGKLIAVAGATVIAFFVGCIAGTMPSLYKEANGPRWKIYHWLTLAASAALTIWGLLSMDKIGSMQGLLDNPKSLTYIITWVVCGVIFALGSIIPGMSPSSLIMYAELYEPMTVGIGKLDMNILLPFLLGVVLCILLFSKLVSWLFEKAGSTMFAIILGVVIASTILVTHAQVICAIGGIGDIIGSVLAAIAGFVLVVMLAKLDPR